MRISFSNIDICSRDYNDFTVIYDLKNKVILKLENVAADIWNFICSNEDVDFAEIVDYIVQIYDCNREDIIEDVEFFLNDLFSTGIIKLNGEYVTATEPLKMDNATQKEIDDFEGTIIQELQEINQLYSVTFEMTYLCNEKCIHCYAHEDTNDELPYIISVEKYKEVIDILYDMRCMHIVFTGGDPFMYREFMEIYSYARKKNFVCDIFTNGLYLANHSDILYEIIKSRPRAFYISLYGADSETHDKVTCIKGSFEKTISVARQLKQEGVSVVFNIMILSLNYFAIDDMLVLAKKIGAEYRVSMSLIYTNSGSDSPMNYFVNDKTIIKKILKKVRKNLYSFDVSATEIQLGEYMCGAGVTSLSIAPDGIIYPCVSLKYPLGNINFDSIDDVWNGETRIRIIENLKWENTKECQSCKYQSSCPHCPGISQAETGDCFSCNTCDRIIAECISTL